MDISPIDLQKALKGASYPSSRDDLVDTANGNSADSQVIDILKRIPDRSYDGPDQVNSAVADV